MGVGSSNNNKRTPIGPISFRNDLINGSYGERGDIYKAENDAADLFFTHHFIYVKNSRWNHFKIYEWTKKGLKMYCCNHIKVNEKTYLGNAFVSDIYKVSLFISKKKTFSSVSFNCKDWVEMFEKEIIFFLI